MTDHDQTTLELFYERKKTSYLRQTTIALAVALVCAIASATVQGIMRDREIDRLTAKCGLERP